MPAFGSLVAAGAELDAAGISDRRLRGCYLRCRQLNARHGRTYFLATRLLSPGQRPAIHALYGFARWADDLVDEPAPGQDPAAELDRLGGLLGAGLDQGHSEHPVVAAVVHTAQRYELPRQYFADFLDSMRMDTKVTEYATFAELGRYVRGSAEVIGLQVLPVLGTTVPRAEAEPYAAALGAAFQLTNFLRDVGEDLDRDRLYLPAEELAAFGVDRELLHWCRRTGRGDLRVRRLLAHLVAMTTAGYRRAAPGIGMLAPVSRPCVRTAFVLYGRILDEIVAADYDVLNRRVAVSGRRRLVTTLPAVGAALVARFRASAEGRISTLAG